MSIFSKRFLLAIEIVLAHEGGWQNHPQDKGGPTNYGISLRFLENLPDGDINKDGSIDAEDIASLTHEQAVDFYWREFWQRHGYERLDDNAIAAKIFDLCVNMGPKPAHRLLQRALRAVGEELIEDGVLGPKTIAAANSVLSGELLAALKSEAAGYYRLIAALNPDQKTFLKGWLSRAYA
ncbi:MAG: glycoside hydrolase family 108 protein [Dongiaceae bacterium]